MHARRAQWLVLFGLASGGCALVGYDFDQYQSQSPTPPIEHAAAGDGGEGGEPPATNERGAAGEGGATESPPSLRAPSGGEGGAGPCQSRGCFDQQAECGVIDDGCGAPLDCGACLWWFQECRRNLCQLAE